MNKREKRVVLIISLVFIAFILRQTFIVYFIYYKSNQSLNAINYTESRLNNQIQTERVEIQSQISSLVDELSTLTSSQDNLKQQVSEIKASASADFSGIIESVIGGVVTIKTDISQGTGFIITDDGYVVTNYHVMEGAKVAGVFTYGNRQYGVSLVGINKVLDVALLKIQGNFDKLKLGNSDDVRIGEKVIAIGNPLGLSFTATEGIISAKDREGINNLPYYFQTDVSLNPGNSGGPLINTKGEVIGINNFKISDAENIGFALQIDYAKDAVNNIALQALNKTIV